MNTQIKNWLVLGAALLLSVLAILWIKVVNRGELTIRANPPFTLSLSPLGGNHECLTSPCSVSVKPGEYTVNLTKPEYFAAERGVKIQRRGETRLEHDFRPIPRVQVLGDFSLPEPTKKVLATVHDLEEKKIWLSAEKIAALNAFAAKEVFDEISLSPRGESFVALERKQGNLLWRGFDSEVAKRIRVAADIRLAWQGEKKIYLLHWDQENKKQLLRRWDLNSDKEPELITGFGREIEKSALYPDLEDRFLAASDIQEGAETRVYLVDTEKKSKEKILDLPNLAGWKWSPKSDYALYQVNSSVDGLPVIHIYDRRNQSSRETRVPVGLELAEWIGDHEFAFLSNAALIDYIKGGDAYAAENIFGRFKLAAKGLEAVSNDIILAYDIRRDHWQNLTEYSNYPLFVSSLALDAEKNRLLLLAEGKLLELPLAAAEISKESGKKDEI